MRTVLIGVDIGTQGVKGVAYTVAGKLLATAFRTSKLLRSAPGAVEEDPEYQFSSACRVIKECVAKASLKPGEVLALAFDGQMAGVTGVGAGGRNVTPYDSWLDTRCAPYIAQMEKTAGDAVLSKTGCPPSFNHGPKILRWKKEFPAVYRDIRAFVQPAGYVAMRCCNLRGDEAFIDKTYLHFSGFADNVNACWDPGLCAEFAVDPAKLPAIVDPHARIGSLSKEAARKTGLAEGVPVMAGCGDTAASFLACGAAKAGVCVDVAGTASVFAFTATAFAPDRTHRTLACGQAAAPGLWHPYAYINGGGMNLEWFLREIANRGRSSARGAVRFETLNRLLEKHEPRPDAPLFVPHLGGRVCPSQPQLRGAWVGLNWSHSLTDLYRAVLEGVALEYAVYKEILGGLYPALALKEVRITGGGEKSAAWNAIKADALGVPVVQLRGGAGAPMGAALVAGYGVGAIPSLPKAAEAWTQKGRRHAPRRTTAAYYQKRLTSYKSLLRVLAQEGE